MAKKPPQKPPEPEAPKPSPKMGRPKGQSSYPPEIWDEIIDRHSEGETITAICQAEAFPTVGWVSRKAADDLTFGKRLARAHGMFADAIFQESIEIADGSGKEKPMRVNGAGELVVDASAAKADVHRDRLRVATRMQVAARMNPAKYAERFNVNHSGAIDMHGVDDAALNSRIERKLYELGVIEMFERWKLAADRVKEFLELFRVIELPKAAAPMRLLPGETEKDLEL